MATAQPYEEDKLLPKFHNLTEELHTILLAAFTCILAIFLVGELLPISKFVVKAGAPAFTSSLSGVTNTVKIAKEVGDGAINNTGQYDVCGTDLGSMFDWNGKTYIAFGDTTGCPLSANTNWRSNTMAVTTDTTSANGLNFDSWILGGDGKAKELFGEDPGAVTVIPTYGVSVGTTGYLFYMQVTSWDSPGRWTCNYSSIATSTDAGQNWTKQSSTIQWAAGNFNQVALLKKDGYVYVFGIPCGRYGSVKLARVPEANILNKSSYQYFSGFDTLSNPTWATSESNATTVASGPVGELSVVWNVWLGRYIMIYLDDPGGRIVIREGIEPWGPWGNPITVATSTDYPALYGAYMHPSYQENNGETIYFRMSQFFPIYSTFWMKTTLVKTVSNQDSDGDGVLNDVDNCPEVANADQKNTDAQKVDNGSNIPGDFDVTIPNGDSLGDVCDSDDDNDWLTDSEEATAGTNPTNKDTDGDRVLDGVEVKLNTNPKNSASKPSCSGIVDNDKDCLPADMETLLGSSDSNKDSDGDGFNDAVEFKGYGTDPTKQDTDSDACFDWIEIVDVNGDKRADILDVTQVAQAAYNAEPSGEPSPTTEPSATLLDIDKNGTFNILDVQIASRNSTLVKAHSPCQ